MMGKVFRRFLAPTALSLALHVGAGVGICKIFHTPEATRPKITFPVLHEEIEKKPDLNALKKEKEAYVANLLSKLQKGEKIQLSGFLIKSQALDANIYFAEQGERGYDESFLLGKYNSIMKDVKKALRGKEDQVESLFEFLHTKVLKEYYYKRGSLLDLLKTRQYNCSSSTQLFSALLEDALGETRHKVLLFDDHVKSFFKGKTIENTNHDWKKARKMYNGCGLIAPPKIFVAAYLLGNGVEKSELPKYLSKLYKPRRLWKGCSSKGKKFIPSQGWGNPVFPSLGVMSGLDLPMHPVPNPKFGEAPEEIVKTAKALRALRLLSAPHEERDFIKTEINGSDIMAKPIIIPSNVDWGRLLEENASSFSNYSYNSYMPARTTCMQSHLISIEVVFETIEHLANTSRPDLEPYTKKNVCGRFKALAEKRDYERMHEYSDFITCMEVNDLLLEAYAPKEGDRKFNWLLSTIASMEVKDNFDYFLAKLKEQGENVHFFIEYGLVLADKERGCPILKAHNSIQRDPFSALVTVCRDQEETWKQVVGEIDDYPPFEFIDGRRLSAEQIQYLKELVETNKEHLRKKAFFLEIARIFYEYGEKERAIAYVSEVVEYATSPKAEYLFNFGGGFHPAFIPQLKAAIDYHKSYTLEITQGILCSGKREEVPPEAMRLLKEMVLDKGEYEAIRIDAANLLLWLGVDPLRKF